MCVHSCVSAVPFRGYHFYPLSISQARINSFVPPYLFLLSIQLMRPLWLTDIRGLTFYSYYFESYLEQKITVFQIECWNEIIKVASSRFASFPLSQSCNAAVDSFELFVVGKVPRRGMSECRSVFHVLDDDSLSCGQAPRRTMLPPAVARVTIHRAPIVRLVILIIIRPLRSSPNARSTRFNQTSYLRAYVTRAVITERIYIEVT